MKEHSIKSVRLTPTVKARLDTFKGSDTVSVCVDRMITFFEITGFNPPLRIQKSDSLGREKN